MGIGDCTGSALYAGASPEFMGRGFGVAAVWGMGSDAEQVAAFKSINDADSSEASLSNIESLQAAAFVGLVVTVTVKSADIVEKTPGKKFEPKVKWRSKGATRTPG